MGVVGRLDERGNFIFEVKSKRILIDIAELKKQTGRDIPVLNTNYFLCLGFAKKGKGSVHLNFKSVVNPKHQNSYIRREVVEILAHEVRHVLQDRREGRLLSFFKKLTWFIYPSLIIIICAGIISFLLATF